MWLDHRLLVQQMLIQERREERDLFRQTMLSVTRMVETAFEAQRAQNDAFREFLDSYKITEPPKLREYDEEAADERYVQKRLTRSPIPELDGLHPLQQYEKLLDKMDKFALDTD